MIGGGLPQREGVIIWVWVAISALLLSESGPFGLVVY